MNTLFQLVQNKSDRSFNEYLYGKSSYKFSSGLYRRYPELKGRVSITEEKSIGSNVFEKLPEIFSDEKQSEQQIGIYGRINNERVTKWLDRDLVEWHPNLERYKVFLPASNGNGDIGEVLSNPLVGQPFIGHTQTFISFGAFDTEQEAQNCLKYIKTDFARAMLGTLKVTQHNQSKEVWENVPWFDFTNYSLIDWSKSIAEIEEQLYDYFNVPDNIVAEIKSNVKRME